MKKGKTRFDIQIEKIENLLTVASEQENPATWLFVNDFRTPIFMLEGLSKMYGGVHDKKTFDKLLLKFKELEDALGAVDYYGSFSKEFAQNTSISAEIKSYLNTKTKEKTTLFSKILVKEDWLNGKRIKKIKKKLKDIDWLKESNENDKIVKFYKIQIDKIIKFLTATEGVFDNMEDDVHELRRKLRWLSIYPQALNGVIKLKENKPLLEFQQKYLTEEITKSPFNKLISNKEQTYFIEFDKNSFLALSWMIAELGKIKDKGLKIHVLKEAIQETLLINDDDALQKTYETLGKTYPKTNLLLQEANEITRIFIKEDNLSRLIK